MSTKVFTTVLSQEWTFASKDPSLPLAVVLTVLSEFGITKILVANCWGCSISRWRSNSSRINLSLLWLFILRATTWLLAVLINWGYFMCSTTNSDHTGNLELEMLKLLNFQEVATFWQFHILWERKPITITSKYSTLWPLNK